jgi:hypothetical protein
LTAGRSGVPISCFAIEFRYSILPFESSRVSLSSKRCLQRATVETVPAGTIWLQPGTGRQDNFIALYEKPKSRKAIDYVIQVAFGHGSPPSANLHRLAGWWSAVHGIKSGYSRTQGRSDGLAGAARFPIPSMDLGLPLSACCQPHSPIFIMVKERVILV